MKNVYVCIAFFVGLSLTGCSIDSVFTPTSYSPPPPPPSPTSGMSDTNDDHYQMTSQNNQPLPMSNQQIQQTSLPGPVAYNQSRAVTPSNVGPHSMDGVDKTKFTRALDSGLGKSTHWLNANTNISYTVTPTKKVEVNGNSFCRTYNLTTIKGDQTRESSGTACVTADGSWQSV